MFNVSRLTYVLLVLAAFAVALGFWFGWGVSSERSQLLSSFTENSVRVEISLERNSSGQLSLAGKFAPIKEPFHLYSKDLPRDGIDGIGRPTLLEIISEDTLQSIGVLVADQSTLDSYSEALEQSFPVYPEGAVILRLPVKLVSSRNDAAMPVELSVTYMACGNGVCLPPVIDKRIRVIISTSGY